MLSIEQPDGRPPKSVDMTQITKDIAALEKEMRDEGVWVFNDHLAPAKDATVVRTNGHGGATKKGPYRKGAEHVGGISIIKTRDMRSALAWGRKLAHATTLPVEVREFLS